MKKIFFLFTALVIVALSVGNPVNAQQYKLKQVSSMMGMKSESTIYVKGMRKRTEGGSMMGMPNNIVTIEQCDLKRTIKLNDQKKLYYIDPFSNEVEEVIDEDAKPAAVKTKPLATPTTTQKGGTITMWYSINDTGERKKMWGLTARHVWTYQKMKPSPDACTMKDSIIIKTDGWYIDLPQFNCPVQYKPSKTSMQPEQQKPECVDKFVTRRSGKGKLGFPLTEKRTMIMGGQGAQTSEFTTDIETLELTTGKLDSMLFEIPPGYKEAKSESELQDKMDMNAMIKQYTAQADASGKLDNGIKADVSNKKRAGVMRIGVYEPKGDQVQGQPLQTHLVLNLSSDKVEAIPVASEDEAREKNCDYTLATDFTKVKAASKVGGLLKAIKNSDPNAASSFNIDAGMVLIKLEDGSVSLQPQMSGKYEGKVDEAEKRVVEEGAKQVLKGLK